jgi:hypothetical protein
MTNLLPLMLVEQLAVEVVLVEVVVPLQLVVEEEPEQVPQHHVLVRMVEQIMQDVCE